MTTRSWVRDADKSKTVILDAAEDLFAEHGYDATSIEQIAERAKLSRGAPRYFFGSKAELYRAVLSRQFEQTSAAIQAVRDQVPADARLADLIKAAVDSYLDFLIARPNYIRLVSWESLRGAAGFNDLGSHSQTLQAGIAAFEAFSNADHEVLARILVAMIGLCWFPIAHNETLLNSLAMDIHDPLFRARWSEQIQRMMLACIP